jgi:hypothetical protein
VHVLFAKKDNAHIFLRKISDTFTQETNSRIEGRSPHYSLSLYVREQVPQIKICIIHGHRYRGALLPKLCLC